MTRSQLTSRPVSLLLLLILAVVALCVSEPVRAQEAKSGYLVPLVTSGQTELTRVTAPDLAEGRSRAATATIVVTYNGFTPEAQAAFQYAVDIWETLIVAPVTIRINANWTPLGPGILGSCGPTQVWRDFTGAPVSNIWYPVALANQLHGSDLNTSSVDMNANFSSVFDWYLGTDGNCPAGKYDLVSVILHEIGHGLGFLGTGNYSGGTGYLGSDGHLMRYDQLVVNGSGTALTSYTNPSTALGSQLVSNNLFFNGANAKAANGGVRPKLYTPTTWNGGSSYSHWDDATYPAGNGNSLMTHALSSGESIHTPGNMTLGLLKDIGWTAATLTPRPDAVIRHTSEASYIGDNIYNTTGASQTSTFYAPNSVLARYYVRVYNDGTASDTFRVKGTAGNASFTARYYNDITGVEITSDILSTSGWLSPSVDTGGYTRVRVDVTPGAAVAFGTSFTATVTAISQANPALSDVVKAVTIVRKTQPDLWVRNGALFSIYAGDNIYNTSGVDQTASQFVRRGGSGIYYVRFYNDGNTTDNIKVIGWAGATGNNIHYFTSAGTDITADVVGTGWFTGSLAPGGYTYIYYRISPDNTITEGSTQTIYVTGYSVYDSTKRDTVKTVTTIVRDQPDGLLKVTGATLSLGSNIYNTTAVSQELKQVIAPGQTADFTITIQNDGNLNDSYTVLGWPGAAVWGVKYFDPNNTDVTAAVVAGTYNTGSLAPGGSTTLRVTLTPDNTVGAGGQQSLLVTLTSVGTPAKKDAVKPVAQTIYYWPDLHIRNWVDATYVGDNVYNTTGTGQTKTQDVRIGEIARYMVRVQNDANTTDTYTVTGPAGTAGYNVKYFTGGGSDITAQVTGSGWVTPALVPNGTTLFYAQLQPNNSIPEGSVESLLILATSNGNPVRKDAVHAVTTVAKDQPDGLIRNDGEPSYIGSNVYNTTAAGQTKTQYAYTGVTVTFNVLVQNDSNVPDAIKVNAPAGGAAWNVKYIDGTGGGDITAAVTGAGWTTDVLAPGNFRLINVTVTPDATIAPTSLLRLPIYQTSTSSAAKRDVVEADVIKRLLRPDGQVRNKGEANYDGDNIYNGTGVGQVKAQSVKPLGTATYEVLVENDGNNPADFIITGSPSVAGWDVKFSTPDGNGGFTDITAAMTTNGYQPKIDNGKNVQILVDVTPTFAAASGSVRNVYVIARAKDDTAQYDAVRTITTVLSGYRPDLQIRNPSDNAYAGNNVYNLDGTDQSKSQIITSGSATYYFLLQNDGNASDVLKVTGTGGSTNWTVRYYASGYGEITTDVTGAGWSSGTLSPGASLGLWVTVTPGSLLINGSSRTLTITGTSQNDPTQQDVVKATTQKGFIIILP